MSSLAFLDLHQLFWQRIVNKDQWHHLPPLVVRGEPPADQAAPGSARETIGGLPMPREVLDAVAYGVFAPEEPQRLGEPVDELMGNDHFMVTSDFASFAATQAEVSAR